MTKNFKPFTNLSATQTRFLETFLRGTSRQMSEAQAKATYGIMNLRARISDLRSAGLKVRVSKNTKGRAAYSISSRDINGKRSAIFVN